MTAVHFAGETTGDAGLSRAPAVVEFWSHESGHWFSKSAAFDRRFRERFLPTHEAAARGGLQAWQDTPTGTLALLILLDQYPRNAFHGTPRMYATDRQARAVARDALARGHMQAVPEPLRLFFCLPFAHSEDPVDQERSVDLNARLGPVWESHAIGHRDIIRRFGRFPHRNAILGRATTRGEQAFLDRGGFAG